MNAEDINLLAVELADWIRSTNGRSQWMYRIGKQTIETDDSYYKKLSGLGWEHKLIKTSFVNLCSIVEEYSNKNLIPVPENIKFRLTLMSL